MILGVHDHEWEVHELNSIDFSDHEIPHFELIPVNDHSPVTNLMTSLTLLEPTERLSSLNS